MLARRALRWRRGDRGIAAQAAAGPVDARGREAVGGAVVGAGDAAAPGRRAAALPVPGHVPGGLRRTVAGGLGPHRRDHRLLGPHAHRRGPGSAGGPLQRVAEVLCHRRKGTGRHRVQEREHQPDAMGPPSGGREGPSRHASGFHGVVRARLDLLWGEQQHPEHRRPEVRHQRAPRLDRGHWRSGQLGAAAVEEHAHPVPAGVLAVPVPEALRECRAWPALPREARAECAQHAQYVRHQRRGHREGGWKHQLVARRERGGRWPRAARRLRPHHARAAVGRLQNVGECG
mmetsp:Transcript_65607/g.200985  ORF Transcript_65607/g.200985 Transcript_65607/m.200985 type:complete len:288 (+) Transcript_65607:690-1553(+)